MEITPKLKIWHFAIFQSFLTLLLGLLAGMYYSIGGLILDVLVSLKWIISDDTSGLSIGSLLAFGALIGMPLIFATFGLIAGIAEAVLYNLFMKFIYTMKGKYLLADFLAKRCRFDFIDRFKP